MPIKNAFFFHDDNQGLGKNRSVIETGMKHKKWAKLSLISTIHSFILAYILPFIFTFLNYLFAHIAVVKNADNKSLNPKKPRGGFVMLFPKVLFEAIFCGCHQNLREN